MTQRPLPSNGTLVTGTILDRILARTAIDVETRQSVTSVGDLERRITSLTEAESLIGAMKRDGISVIAEMKRASPSRGRFPVEIDAAQLAQEYAAGGADAISVLTDEPFFEGSLADLETVAGAVKQISRPVPVLRKDFVLCEYQLLEARAFGASAVLLMVAALDQELLVRLLDYAKTLGLDVLVEVHDEAEMDRAGQAGATLIGINNRNLHTFDVDLAVAERLAGGAPADAVLVGESGIFTPGDAARMANAGLDGILVGESLVLAADRAAAIVGLKRGDRHVVASVDS